MSILPYFFDDLDLLRPAKRSRKVELLDNFLTPSSAVMFFPKRLFEAPDYIKNKAAIQFQVNFYVQHFKPEEMCVKLSEDKRTITIEAKHEEKQDERCQIYRHFVRKYTLPKDCDINNVKSKLSSDEVLSITAPRISRKRKPEEPHRSIPIIQTGHTAKSVKESKPERNKMEIN